MTLLSSLPLKTLSKIVVHAALFPFSEIRIRKGSLTEGGPTLPWSLSFILPTQSSSTNRNVTLQNVCIVRSNSSMLIIDFISYFGTLLDERKCKLERKSNLFVIIPYHWCARISSNLILETNVACLEYSKKPPISITKYLGRLVDFFWYFIFLRSLFWLCKSTKCLLIMLGKKVLKNTSKNDKTFDRNTRTVG